MEQKERERTGLTEKWKGEREARIEIFREMQAGYFASLRETLRDAEFT